MVLLEVDWSGKDLLASESVGGIRSLYSTFCKMKRIPESGLPFSRSALPEGCSDLIDAYKQRASTQEEYDRHLLRIAAQLHDIFVEQLDSDILASGNQSLVAQKISDFLHPILFENNKLSSQIRSSSDLVDILLHVVLANYEDE